MPSKVDPAARSAVAAPGPIQRAGTFLYQLDRQDETGVNLWSGHISPNNGCRKEHAIKAATLFEAAPDLLAALECAEARLRALATIFNSINFTDRYGDGPACQRVADLASAAIKKARGE